MKYFLFLLIILLLNASCNSQNKTQQETKEIQTSLSKIRPGTIPSTEGGWMMTAKINGENWKASSIMPPEAAGRIIGYSGEEYIGLPYNKNEMIVGKKDIFDKDNAVDLATTDEVDMWGGRKGEMEITKVENGWAEGRFHFTATAHDTNKTKEVTDGFFKIKFK